MCGIDCDQQVQADPHFKGGHGDTFDFKGRHQTTYNLLSHQALSVNAYFENVDYTEGGKKFFAWEDAKDLSKYAKMSAAALEKELKSKNKTILEKWVD